MRSPPAVLDITSTEGELKTPSDCERDQLQAYTSTTSTCSTVIRERHLIAASKGQQQRHSKVTRTAP